jgi:hypothetical protein
MRRGLESRLLGRILRFEVGSKVIEIAIVFIYFDILEERMQARDWSVV